METIGTLAGGIAHDFNNILQAILGYSELVRQKMVNGNEAFHELEVIIQAGTRAKELVHHILSFSRENKPEWKQIDMGLIVREALKLLRASLPATIEISSQIDEIPHWVLADSTQIHQLIMNLCTNAAHAMGESGGLLEVALEMVNVDAEMAAGYADLMPGRFSKIVGIRHW